MDLSKLKEKLRKDILYYENILYGPDDVSIVLNFSLMQGKLEATEDLLEYLSELE